jgi:NodT family efflux transporter outer membrane factor (OMF) lipoprotein
MTKPYRRRRLGCVVIAVLLPGGCAVGPDFQSPEPPEISTFLPGKATDTKNPDTVPGRTFEYGGDVPADWWRLFRSPALDQLVQDGIAHNQDLQAAEAAVRVAQANARAQRGALFPTVVAGFGASRTVTPYKAVSTNAANDISVYSLYTPQVTVSYVPDVWGGTRRLLESTVAQTELAVFQREALYLTLASSIALAAIEEARLDGQISSTRRIIEIQSELLNILRKQNEQGQIALPDVVAQETAVAQAKLLLPPLERQLAQQRHLLAFLTGRFPTEVGVETFRFAAFRLPRRLPLSLPGNVVRQRPDIRAAEANLHSLNAQIGVAIANRLPQITLTGTGGIAGLNIAQLFTPGTAAAQVAGSVVQTVFDAETLENRQRAAEEATVQALAQYRSTVLAAFQNVADTLRALQADARAIEAATAAEQSASQNIGLIRQQVEQGQASIPILLVAQQAFLQTSLALVDAKAARLADTVVLFQALGGGWWNRPVVGPPGNAL